MPECYLELIRRFPLRPIRDDRELECAEAAVDELLGRDDLDESESDYLDVLADLIHTYENARHPIEPASDAELLQFLLESNELTQAALSKATGIAESTISSILSGNRSLSGGHISKISHFFGVEPSVFFQRQSKLSSKQVIVRLRQHG